jgi:uncharacterized lipoprotein
MMYFTRLFFFLAVTSVAGGCGMFSDKDEYAYRNAKSIKTIEMPPGLVMANASDQLSIPEQSTTTSSSEKELEIPPAIITSVDLKELDDNRASKPVADKNKAEKGAKNSLDTAEVITNKTTPPKIIVTKNGDGDSMLLAEGNFDFVWPLVKPALVELGFNIDDNSRGNQLYSISKNLPTFDAFDKTPHPGDEKPEVKEEYQIHVKPADGKTQITVHNKLGQLDGSGLADHLLLQIKEIIEKPKKAPASSG